jgi:hypothetical protein
MNKTSVSHDLGVNIIENLVLNYYLRISAYQQAYCEMKSHGEYIHRDNGIKEDITKDLQAATGFLSVGYSSL